MGEISTVRGIMRSVVSGPAWHGPSVAELLDGVSAEQAATKPLPGTHSIWELVLHIDAWQSFTLRTCEGESVPMLEGDADWPPVTDTSEEAWAKAKGNFAEHGRLLDQCISEWDDTKARSLVPGRDFPFKVLLHGVAHHNLYHAGQIAMLKKAKG